MTSISERVAAERIYVHQPWRVAAIQWTGDNFTDVEQFARDYIGDPKDIGLRNEPYEETIGGRHFTYNTVQFYAWNDDQEVDPDRWIVVDVDVEPPTGAVFHDDEFRIAYGTEPAITSRREATPDAR